MVDINNITFINSKSAAAHADQYTDITVCAQKALKSWRLSVYSFEWLDKDGKIKPATDLNDAERAKRKDIETALKNGAKLEKPVLGLGMADNIEIGSGRAAMLTLIDMGAKTIPVNIRKAMESDFEKFRADV